MDEPRTPAEWAEGLRIVPTGTRYSEGYNDGLSDLLEKIRDDEAPNEVFYEVCYHAGGFWFHSSTHRSHPATESELRDMLAKMQADRAAMAPPLRPKDNVDAIRLDRHEIYRGQPVPHPDSE